MKASVALLIAVSLLSCKKETDDIVVPNKNGLTLNIRYEADGSAVMKDSIMYPIDAGYLISVVTFKYYLSEIMLVRTDGTKQLLAAHQYVDFNDPQTNKLVFTDLPAGNYKAISFNIGIDSLHNIPDGLPATPDNINMYWPVPMGGGYHFIKLEGYYKDSSGTYGYAMHLGMNQNLIPVQLDSAFTIAEKNIEIGITLNLNEWFRNPYIYDFNIDGNYSMSSMSAMNKLHANGMDVFHY